MYSAIGATSSFGAYNILALPGRALQTFQNIPQKPYVKGAANADSFKVNVTRTFRALPGK